MAAVPALDDRGGTGVTAHRPRCYGSHRQRYRPKDAGIAFVQCAPTTLSTTDTNSTTPIFWERFRDWVSVSGSQDGSFGGDRGRSGLAITICILIALFLWFTLTLRDVHTDTVEVPLRVDNIPADQALVEYPPATVRIQVRGEGFNLMRLRFNPPVLAVDGSQDEVDLTDVAADLGRDVQVENVSPRALTLRKEPLETQRVPVQLRASITTPSTFELLEPPTIQPDSITVAGARSIVEELAYWPTETYEHTNLRDTLETRVALSDTLRGLIRKDRAAVTLRAVSVAFTEGTREIPVRVTGVPSDVVTLDPSTVRLRYRVALDDYGEADRADDLFATVPYDEIRTDTTGFVTPRVNLPTGILIRDVQIEPERLRYYIALQ